MVYKSSSLKEAENIIGAMARNILAKKNKPLIFGLTGDLGSGKTFFVKKFLKNLGIKEKVLSPTFVIIKEYKIPSRISESNKIYKRAFHIDAYRLLNPADILRIGFNKILGEENSIILIEWAEKLRKFLPKNTIWIKFEHGKKENERIIEVMI